MSLFERIPSLFKAIFQRRRIEQEMLDELQFHVEARANELSIKEELSRDEAVRQARIEFGGIEKYKEEGREAFGFRIFDELRRDIHYAFRMLRKNPGFTIVAVATLALGIGANTAIFSIVDGVILRPLSYRDAGRLVSIHEFPGTGPSAPVNLLHFYEWEKTTRSFERMALLNGFTANLTGGNESERVDVGRVSAALFPMLGVRAQLGRTFIKEEEQLGRDYVAIIDDGLWRRRFGSDPGVVGRTLMLDGTRYEIVGVLPAEFQFPRIRHLYAMTSEMNRPDLWVPFAPDPQEISNSAVMGQFNHAVIGRLKPGVTLEQAASEVNVVQASIANRTTPKVELAARIVPLQDQIIGTSRLGLELALTAVGIILLIACVNVTNLLLARASARKREMAIRTAIGASRARLVRQMLVEAIILSAAGAVCGVFIAWLAIPLIVAVAPRDIPRLEEIHVDARILVFAVGISTLTALLIGLMPSWRFAKTDLMAKMPGLRTTADHDSGRVRSVLVSIEVALTATCLIVGGLLLHSFVKLLSVDPGFDSGHTITIDVNMGRGDNSRYSGDARRIPFVETVSQRLGAVPGVSAVGITDTLPLTGVMGISAMYVDGPDVPLFERPMAAVRTVNSDYFPALQVPLLSGRLFDESDRGKRIVAVISQATAERVWPGQNPLGKQFRFRNQGPFEVIGVVSDVREESLAEAPPLHVYLPYWQGSLWFYVSFIVKTRENSPAVASAVRTAIREIDPELPFSERTMDEIVGDSVAQQRFRTNLVLLFAAAAVLLASLGIYGLMSYSVLQRTNEIGIRMALGAAQASVRRMVLINAWQLVAAGLLVGIPLGLVAAQTLRTLLFGITPLDWITLTGSCALLATVATIAAYLPARRASHIDPMVALRHD